MKRTAALLLAVLMAAVLLPAGALAEEPEPVGALYYGQSVEAFGLAVGDTFTVTYSVSPESMLADCALKLRYDSAYVTPVDFSVYMWGISAFEKSADAGARYEDEPGYLDLYCTLECSDDTGRYSSVRAEVDHNEYFNLFGEEFNDSALIDIVYRIDALPVEGMLPVDDIGAFIEFEIIAEESNYYTGEYYGDIDPDGSGHDVYVTAPHDNVETVPARVYMPIAPLPWPEAVSVVYTGSREDARALVPGDSFYWTFSVSEGSRLWSGFWLVDYPEQYLVPEAVSVSWSGSLTAAINASWDDGSAYSDVPTFVYRAEYEGQTGALGYGEAGNMYTLIGMYLSSFEFGGLMAGGEAVRISFNIIALPETAEAQYDEEGYYLDIPITVMESVYWPEGFSPAEAASDLHSHEEIEVVDGRVYYAPADAKSFTYVGGTADVAGLAEGDTFTLAYSIPGVSLGYYNGRVWIDYPEQYFTPVEYFCPWDGFMPQFFDEPSIACDVELETDVDGNMMTYVFVSYPTIASDTTLECPDEAEFIFITYRIDSLPEEDILSEDENGRYIEIPIVSAESTFVFNYYHEVAYPCPYESSIPARVYLPSAAPAVYSVSFYGFKGELLAEVQVEEGCAADAPDAPASVAEGDFTYYFMWWEESFDCVTEDTEVHAKYLCMGDVDGSGEVTFSDIGILYAFINGSITLPEEYLILADINGDGTASFTDISILYMLLLG